MELSEREFNAMSSSPRQWLLRYCEVPIYHRMGLSVNNKDVLEIGCGNGYGASLLLKEKPQSYLGIDLMPAQIRLAELRRLKSAEFRQADATDLSFLPDRSKDLIIIFGVLHHIPNYPKTVAECARILRPGGELYNEEPDGRFLIPFERLFHWGHPQAILLLRDLEETYLNNGFKFRHKFHLFGFGFYGLTKM
jgi:ubiquinone/menaquinone biosynthesis C-methylase UbiE